MRDSGTGTQAVRRAVVVYESMFGDTAQVAEAVAQGLRSDGVEVRCQEVGALDRQAVLDADLLVVGAPTHRFSLSSPGTREDAVRRGAPSGHTSTGVREWLTQLSPGPHAQAVATFDTRLAVLEAVQSAAAAAMRELAVRHGFEVVGEPMGFLVEHTRGPVVAGEVARAEGWGHALAHELADHTGA